ncbi:MAG: lysophospholipid acyltransferase family protein [Thermomicrobiales bacterium]
MISAPATAREPDVLTGTIHGWPRTLLMKTVSAFLRPLIGLEVWGVEHVPPEGPLIVVSNHLSNADPPLVSIAFPRPLFFMGKAELFRNPLLGFLVKLFGGFPVQRGTADRAAIRHALKVLNQGQAVGIFPEGGRSRTAALAPGFPGVGLIALQARVPVIPVAITGTEYFPVNGDRPPKRPKGIPSRVTVTFGETFTVPERVDGRRVTPEEATRLLMVRVAELLPEQYRGVYSSDT